MYVLMEAQDSMLHWQVWRFGSTSWVMVLASASRLTIKQLRNIVALRARVQHSMHSKHSSKKFRVRVCTQTVGKLY